MPAARVRRDLSHLEEAGHELHRFESVEALEGTARLPAGVLSVGDGDGDNWIDVLYEPRGSDTTVVFFYGAVNWDAGPVPVFLGDRVFGDLPVNRIRVFDPGLYRLPGLQLAWYGGTADHPVQRTLPRVLDSVVAAAGGSRAMLFGVSGGGYASLYYGRAMSGALTVAINPQTVIRSYRPQGTWYARSAFGTPGDESPDEAFARFDSELGPLYAQGHANRILYVQNETDELHIDRHVTPLFAALGLSYDSRGFDDAERLSLITGNWGRGHVAPVPKQMHEMVASMVGTPGADWSALDLRKARRAIRANRL